MTDSQYHAIYPLLIRSTDIRRKNTLSLYIYIPKRYFYRFDWIKTQPQSILWSNSGDCLLTSTEISQFAFTIDRSTFLLWATETLHYHNYMHTTDRHWMLAVSPVAYLAKSLHISFIYSWDGGEEIHRLLKNRSLRWILTIFTFNQIDFIHSSPATQWSSRATFWHTSHPPSARKPRSHQLDLRLSISLPVQSTNSSLTSSKSIFSICFLQFTLLHFTCTRHTFSAAVQTLTAEQSKNMRCMHLTQHRGGKLLSPML